MRLTVTNNLGCTSTQTVYPFGTPTASQQAQLWPNPTATGQAYNALGRAVGARHALLAAADGTAAQRLAVAGWPAGVYAVRVQAGALSFAKRLAVE